MIDVGTAGGVLGGVVGILTAAGAVYTAKLSKKTADASNFVKQREEDRRQFQTMVDEVRKDASEAKRDQGEIKRELHDAQAELISQRGQLRDAIDYVGMLRSTMRRAGILIPPAPESLALPRWEEEGP